MTAAEVFSAFHRDAPYLFLGAAFIAIGLVAAAFSLLRRKRDRLLIYFALFAAVYGTRLWIQSRLLVLSMEGPWLGSYLGSCIDYIVPIPAVLFFDAAGLLSRMGRIAGRALIGASVLLGVATAILGPSTLHSRVNNAIVIAAIIAMVTRPGQNANTRDAAITRRGLLIFAGFVLWDNLGGVFSLSLPRLEPIGFLALLGALGYVAARQALQRDHQLRDIQKELEVARRIQLSILPGAFSGSPHFRVAARCVPMTSVAGDFYDYVVADPLQVGLLVADVSGHGVPAALIASMVKLAAASQRSHAGDPAAFLSQMNAALCGNTQEQFVTAAYVHLDAVAGAMRYSAAGHPPMLLLRGGEITEIAENGLLLAAFGFATYSNASHPLERGDRLLLYTDGIVEASNSSGAFFGLNGLHEVFRKGAGVSASEAADLIVTTVQKWFVTQEDDLTVLVCDYLG